MSSRPPDWLWLIEMFQRASRGNTVIDNLLGRPPLPPVTPFLVPPPRPAPPVPQRRISTFASHLRGAVLRTKVVLRQRFDVIEARAIPKSEGFPYNNVGKLIETAVLFADLRGSTELADINRRVTTAKILKVFLSEMARAARAHEAEVRGFAGDRIMVIIEKSEGAATKAVDVAVAMRDVVSSVINPALRTQFGQEIAVGIGIDYGLMLAARVGMPRNPELSDLVWVGSPANHASKLTDAAGRNQILVSHGIFSRINATRYPAEWWTISTANIAGRQEVTYHLSPTASFSGALREAGLA